MENSDTSKLSEVIGALVASIAHARSVADNSSLRIANLYSKNELLKGLPVPRLRIQKVSISLPVILSRVIPGRVAQLDNLDGICDNLTCSLVEAIRRFSSDLKAQERLKHLDDEAQKEAETHQIILRHLEQGNETNKYGEFINSFTDALHQSLDDEFAHLEYTHDDRGQSDMFLRDLVASNTESALRKVLKEAIFAALEGKFGTAFDAGRARDSLNQILKSERMMQLISFMRRCAEESAVVEPTIPPDLDVYVDTNTIKSSGGGADTVTRLNMVLLEEGLEWVAETQGGGETRLMPE